MATKKTTRAEEKEGIDTPVISVKKVKQDLRKKEPPLVDLKVSNPLAYIKSWWKKIIGNEGIEFRIKIRPLTAIAISLIIITVSLGLGKFNIPIPFFEYNLTNLPTPTPEIFRDTAFSGILRTTENGDKFYLETANAEAINLEVPENIELNNFVGSRIFATGRYTPENRVLLVSEATNLEVLPDEITTVPTEEPTPTPTQTPTNAPSPSPEESSNATIGAVVI